MPENSNAGMTRLSVTDFLAALERSGVLPDEKWQERPLAAVVLKEGQAATPDELRAFLQDKVARWWLPERWAFVRELPKTSVGKQDKKLLRVMYADGKFDVVEIATASRS